MSGVLSIVREAYGMFAANPVDSKSIFWVCARIAFILAAAVAWWQEHQTVVALRLQMENAAKAPRTNAEEHHFLLAREGLEIIGPRGGVMLRHLWNHGSLTFSGLQPPLPPNISASDTTDLLNAAESAQLVTRKQTPYGGGWQTTYEIAPGMKTALEELLYTQKQRVNLG